MNADELRRLVEAGESYTVEFKGEERRAVSDDELVLAVVCLANGDGGYVLVGVEDDGRITGARPRHEGGRTDVHRVNALVANKTMPPVRIASEVVELGEGVVLVIRVPDEVRPVGTSDARYVRRAFGGDGRPAFVPFHLHEMLSHEIDRGARDYSTLPIPDASMADLDPLEFERLRRLVRDNAGRSDSLLAGFSDVEILKALGLVANGTGTVLTAGAVLLFGTSDALRRHVPTHEVAFQQLDGTKISVNEIERWPLLRAADELAARWSARNREAEVDVGLIRFGIPLYPEAVFREAVANALVHRDYTRLGAVHVQWRDDELVVSNPGGFPEGVHVRNLLVTPPHPRNPLLADAFKRVGLVERAGRGVNRIFEGVLRYGRPPPDYSRSSDSAVVVVIPGGPAALPLARVVAERGQQGQPLGLDDLFVVNELWRERRITTARAAELMQVPEPEARAALHRMVDAGLVEARGEGRGRTWHLSAWLYRALGEPAGYVRSQGIDPIRQEQMILQYVDAHGRIRRREVMELCSLSDRQATRALDRLVRAGALHRHGVRRGAYYDRSPD